MHELDLNLAVVDSYDVIELNQAFNFRTENSNETRDRIDSWTLKVEKLQQHGGTLACNDKELIVPRDLSVVAVATTPQSTQQRKNYENFQSYCNDLNITVLSTDDVPQHAEHLEKRLAS